MWTNTDIAFATILESLAEFFGTTVDAIQANLAPFLQKYALYAFFDNLPELLLMSLFIAGLFTGGAAFIWGCMLEKDFTKGSIIFFIVFFLVILTIPIGIDLGKMWAMPEVYAIHDIVQILKAA